MSGIFEIPFSEHFYLWSLSLLKGTRSETGNRDYHSILCFSNLYSYLFTVLREKTDAKFKDNVVGFRGAIYCNYLKHIWGLRKRETASSLFLYVFINLNKYITSSCCSVFVQHLSFQDYIQFQILKRGLIVSHPFVSYTKLMTTARQSGSEIRLVVSTFIILIQFQTFLPFDGLVEHCVCFLQLLLRN